MARVSPHFAEDYLFTAADNPDEYPRHQRSGSARVVIMHCFNLAAMEGPVISHVCVPLISTLCWPA